MNFITASYLKNLIFLEISKYIQLHRESKNRSFLYKLYEFALDQEVDDFILSTPYYSDDLKDYLMRIDDPGILVTNSWVQQFTINTELWAMSDEWLYYDVEYIRDPSLNKAPERVELNMPVIGESA
jgi:hypothetical protein